MMRRLLRQSAKPKVRQRVMTVVRAAGPILLFGLLPGCQNMTSGLPVSQLRIIDASPAAPDLDVYQGMPGQNDFALAYNLGFGTVTSYVAIPAGASTIAAHTAGLNEKLATAHGTFAAGAQYTVLIGDVAANLSETILVDQSVPAPPGLVSIRLLDEAARFSGRVDVYLVPGGSTLAATAPVLTNVMFGVNSGYINVPAGSYSMILLPAGAVPLAATVPVYTGAKATYSPGCARTLILLDGQAIGEPAFQVITAEDFDVPTISS